MFARSRDYLSGKFAPKGKNDSANTEKQTNVQIVYILQENYAFHLLI